MTFPTPSIPWGYVEEGASISIKALEPTAYSCGFAYASGGGSPPAFGCAGTTRHGVKEGKSLTVKG
jgi:hypothetical protein